MSFNFLAQKRIMRDIKTYKQGELDKVGIYCNFDDSDIQSVKALIIGPKDTPYENGFYLFDIKFPNDYPFSPPKVKFLTYEDGVRFNPNLYTAGKVCLSILGTWSGPGWTTCLNLNTVLLSIQSLLNSNPLQNEPGFENEVGTKAKNYARLIEYYNVKSATIKLLEKVPYDFKCFYDIMKKHYMENREFFRKYVNDNIPIDNMEVKSSVYSMTSKLEIKVLENKLDKLDNLFREETLVKESEPMEESVSEEVIATPKETVPKKTRKCPNDPAKLYDIGFTKVSENDGKTYKVVEVSGLKRTMKRWVINK